MKSKKIVFYMEAYTRGGAERYFVDLIKGMNAKRYDVRVFCNQDAVFIGFLEEKLLGTSIPITRQKIKSLNTSGIRTGLAKVKNKIGFIGKYKSIPLALLKYAYSLINMFNLYRIFKKSRIDILHINNGGYPGAESCRMAIFVAKIARIPVKIMTFHNIAGNFSSPIWAEKAIDKLLYKCSDIIITSSNASKLSLKAKRNWRLDKVSNVYNGVELLSMNDTFDMAKKRKELGLSSDNLVIGMAAYFQPRKGHLYLLKAFARIKNSYPNLKCIILGEGEAQSEIISLISEMGLNEKIIFAGWRKDFLEVLSVFDVLVMPSIDYESVPYVILDAMAMAKPIIATNAGGLPEAVIDGVTGIIVPIKDDEALAKAIVMLLDDPEKRQNLGIAGRKRIEHVFMLDKVIGEIDSIYYKLNRSKN
jgi:glycosyltransferase involved in cell wall biosynthesis